MGFDKAKFRELRELFGSREKFGKAIGVTGTTVQNWETGRAVPNINDISKSSEVLGVTISDFLDQPSQISRSHLSIPEAETKDSELVDAIKEHMKTLVEKSRYERMLIETLGGKIDDQK